MAYFLVCELKMLCYHAYAFRSIIYTYKHIIHDMLQANIESHDINFHLDIRSFYENVSKRKR